MVGIKASIAESSQPNMEPT
jgi:hypothetical protein